MNLKDFLLKGNVFESSEKDGKIKEEKYSYKDKDGNTITIKKDKDGKIIKIDSEGNETIATEIDLKQAKNTEKEQKKEKDEKEQKKEKDEKDKKLSSENSLENTKKHLLDLATFVDSKFEKGEYGYLGQLMSFVANLTVGTAYNLKKDAESKKANLALAKQTNDMLNDDNEFLAKMDDETKTKYDTVQSAYDRIMGASFDENGELVDDETFKKNIKNSFNGNEEEYEKFIKTQNSILKNSDILDRDIDLTREINDDDLTEITSLLPKESKTCKDRSEKRTEIETEYQTRINDAETNARLSRKSEKDNNTSNNDSIETLQKNLKETEKKLDDLKRNRPEGMSDEQYKAEIEKISKEISRQTKNIERERERAQKIHNTTTEKTEKNLKITRANAQTDYDTRTAEVGIITANVVQRNAEIEINKDDVRIDNDEKLEDEDTSKLQDPHKIWKKRKYKRGDSTLTTKCYYNKKDQSITKEEFDKKVEIYKKKKIEEEKNKKNEDCVMSLRNFLLEGDELKKIKNQVDKVKSELSELEKIKDEITSVTGDQKDKESSNDNEKSDESSIEANAKKEEGDENDPFSDAGMGKYLSEEDYDDDMDESEESNVIFNQILKMSEKAKEDKKSKEFLKEVDNLIKKMNDGDEFEEDDDDEEDATFYKIQQLMKSDMKDDEKVDGISNIVKKVVSESLCESLNINESLKGNAKEVIRLAGLTMLGPGLPLAMLIRHVSKKRQKKKATNTMAMLQSQIDNEKDPEKKKALEGKRNYIKLTTFDKDGKVIPGGPIGRWRKERRAKQLIKKGVLKPQDAMSKIETDGMAIQAKEWVKDPANKQYKKDSKKEFKKARKTQARTLVSKIAHKAAGAINKKSKEGTEEEVVKADDGSTIHPRKKKNGESGYTYVRIKDDQEIGYASKSEYLAAKKKKDDAKKKKNESISDLSLKDYILECLNN